MYADKIIYGENIYSGKGEGTFAGGVAVKDNRILAAGPASQIQSYQGPDTAVFRYDDELILPGFIDNHHHYPMAVIMEAYGIEMYDAPSPEYCVEKVRKYYEAHKDTPMIYGMGWQASNWGSEARFDKTMLDSVSKDIPIFLGSNDGWMFWVNSKALELLGYDKNSSDSQGAGSIYFDETGEPNGILYGGASEKLFYLLNYLDKADSLKIIAEGFEAYVKYGVTSIGEVSNEFQKPDRELGTFQLLDDLYRSPEGEKQPRTFFYPCIGRDGDFSVVKKLRETYSRGKLQLKGLKGYIDGVLTTKTAVMLEPYLNSQDCGTPIYMREELNFIVAKANAEGFAVRIHAIGDGGVRMCLDAYEYSIKKNGRHGLRNCVEHIEACSQEDFSRFRELDVIAAINPAHGIMDESLETIVKEDVFYNLHPFRPLLDAGAVVSVATDAPIVTVNPMLTVYAGVTKRTEEGRLIFPKQGDQMTIWEVLSGYTYLSAYALGAEEELGSLEAGKLADIVVLDRDLIKTAQTDPKRILDTKVKLTMIGGKVAFQNS